MFALTSTARGWSSRAFAASYCSSASTSALTYRIWAVAATQHCVYSNFSLACTTRLVLLRPTFCLCSTHTHKLQYPGPRRLSFASPLRASPTSKERAPVSSYPSQPPSPRSPPHPGAVFGPKQNGRILGQLSITSFLDIREEDLTEQLAVEAQVSLAALKAAWRDGYKWGWLLDYPVAFDHPPVTYDHTATEGTRMGTIFTCTKRAPIKRAIRVQKQKND